jgi:peptidoglycan/LPS O-acetylase OafA/YrhL
MRHLPVLDGIRACAILMVCVAHFFQVDEASLYETNRFIGILFFKLSQLGLTGVELFFVLSGFLITNILLDAKTSRNFFSSFFMRRFLRIFPLYYFVLALSFLLLPLFYVPDAAGQEVIQHQLWLWTYTSNFFGPPLTWDGSVNFPHFGHFWSLSVEEHFYILWPLVIYYVKESLLPKVMWGLVAFSLSMAIAAYALNSVLPPVGLFKLLNWSTLHYAGTLSLGALIACYWRQPARFASLLAICRPLIIPALILFVLQTFIPRATELKPVIRFTASSLFFFAVIVVALGGGERVTRLFSQQILFRIGQISYGLYVYHGLLRPFFKTWFYDSVLVHLNNSILAATLYTLLCTGLSILIAYLSWVLLEQPILRLKRHFPVTSVT